MSCLPFRSLLLTLLLMLILTLPMPLGAMAQKTLKSASNIKFPPFSYLDEKGEATGFDVEITKALCKEMQVECDIVLMPFSQIIPALSKGELDMAVASFARTEERANVIDFTDYYYRSCNIYIVRHDYVKNADPSFLEGKKIGAQLGTIQEDYLRKNYAERIELVLHPTFENLFASLGAGKVDAIFVDALAGYSALNTELGQEFEPLGEAVTTGHEQENARIGIAKNNHQLREDLNKAIQAIVRSGEYEQIRRKYFDFNLY